MPSLSIPERTYDVESRFYIVVCRFCLQPFKTRFGLKRYCSDVCYTRGHPQRTPRCPRWTHAEDAQLRQFAGTMSIQEIAAKVGRTKAATGARCGKLGLKCICNGERHPLTKHSDAVVEQARQLRDEGMQVKAIAAQLNIPFRTVQDWILYRTRLGQPIEFYF